MGRWDSTEHWPLIEARQWDLLEALLTDPALLEGKVAAGLVFALVEDFAAALESLPAKRPGRRRVELLGRAIRRNADFLHRHPGALFQCLWNTCAWHEELRPLLESWRKAKEASSPGFVWMRSLRSPIVPLDSPLLAVLPLSFPTTGGVALSFSSDGERLAGFFTPRQGDPPCAAWLIDVTTGQRLQAGDFPVCRDQRVSPDGRYRLVTGSWDDPVRVLDSGGGEVVALQTEGGVIITAEAFSPDGKYVVAAGYTEEIGGLLLWELASGRRVYALYPSENIWHIAVSSDGRRLACGLSDGIEIRELSTGRLLSTLPGHEGMVRALAFSPDGRLLASAGDGTVRLWDVERPAPPLPERIHPDRIHDLVFSTDGRRLVSRSTNDTTWLWNATTGAPVACLLASTGVVMLGGSADGCVFADARRVISLGHTGGVWDASTGAPLGPIPETRRFFSSSQLAFRPDGQMVAVAGRHGEGLRLLAPTGVAPLRELEGHTGEIQVLAFSPDGNSLVSGSDDGTIRIWPVEGGPPTSLDGHTSSVTAVAFSADGRLVVSTAVDATVRVWDRYGTELACLAPPDIGEWGRRTSWSEGKQSEEIDYGARAVAFTPDGQSVVTLSDGDRLRWWDWRTGTCRRTVQGVGDFRAIAAELPWRALVRGVEVVIESSDGGEVAWLPCAPDSLYHQQAPGLNLTTHPGGCVWAGSAGRHLYHFALEGPPARR